MLFKKTAIIGVGLLGGSLALAMREKKLTEQISGYSRQKANRDWAKEHGILDQSCDTPEEAVEGADFIVLATPVSIIPKLFEQLSGVISPHAIITDVGSVKQNIAKAANKTGNPNFRFVGSHPMAGGEKFSVRYSNPNLYADCLTVVVHDENTDMEALTLVGDVWKAVGSRIIMMSPEEHDVLVAAASHLPHLTAVSLTQTVKSVSEDDNKTLTLLAGGFRDTTRVASGSPEMWIDICSSNQEKILAVLKRYRGQLDTLIDNLSRSDTEALKAMFHSARDFRDAIPTKAKGILGAWFDMQVETPDRPGVVGEICSEIGKAQINIRNLHIRHAREKYGGALSITFETAEERLRASELLEKCGFDTHFDA